MISVTKAFLPTIEEYALQVQRAFNNNWLTNRGELVLELEHKLKEYLNVPYILLTTNGTLPLQIALKTLLSEGEVITTPFSYVATSAVIVWEGFEPVFVDIDPEHLTIDENKIETAITTKTRAILATHVYGNPCNIEQIQAIAKKHNLLVIYDAAHCFGVKYKNTSVFNYGDISTCSFHATKLFHTGEGGAVFCNTKEMYHEVYYRHNFGHDGPLKFHGLGINAKMSELHAAMGLSLFPYIPQLLMKRKLINDRYDLMLKESRIKKIKIRENCEWNNSYYPVIFESEKELLTVEKKLNSIDVFPRRYFYPSLNMLPYVRYKELPVSEKISGSVLCLPTYAGLEEYQIDLISEQILSVIKQK